MSAEDQPNIVVDVGSGSIKAGFTSDDAPRAVVPSVIGRAKHSRLEGLSLESQNSMMGDQAISSRGLLHLEYPMESGQIKNWDAFESLLQFTFTNELRTDVSEAKVLFSEPSLNSLSQREKLTQIMFENHSVQAMYMYNQCILSLFASGRACGMVLDVGEGVCQTVPIYEGFVLKRGISRYSLAGRDINEHLALLLRERGWSFQTPSQMESVRSIKEQLGFVSLDYEADLRRSRESSALETVYELPDGEIITLASERFRCTEALFNPSLLEIEAPGLHDIVHNSITRCAIDLRSMLRTNILLSGGSTMFNNLPERLRSEVKNLCPFSQVVNVVAPIDRKYSTWIGGRLVASLSTFQSTWITKDQYDECGPNIATQGRCL